jgi:hypothetical protein
MKALPLPLLAGLSLALTSCGEKCEGYYSAADYHIGVSLVQANGAGYFDSPANYPFRDSVRVFDEQSASVPLLPLQDPYNLLSFRLIGAGTALELNKPLTRQFVLYLRRADQDTIRTEYELQRGECGREFRYLRIFYNNRQVYESLTAAYGGSLTITKP